MAFFLWSSVPDDALRAAAQSGALSDEAGRRAEVVRMLADPRAASLAERFAVQWLGIDRLESKSLDAQAYPGVDAALVADMRRETERLFDDVVRGRRPLRALLEARTTTLSPRLAAHYGLAPAAGADAFECAIPDGRPGGILGHASILLATSNPTRTSPVKRGRWVLDALLDVPPAPPPPGVPQIPEDPLGRAGRSMRELMELHRSNPDCASCHVRMDAVGLAFERFDADGRVRSVADGLPVDDVTALPDGRVLEGVSGVEQLVAEGDAFERALARHLLVYALGRGTRWRHGPGCMGRLRNSWGISCPPTRSAGGAPRRHDEDVPLDSSSRVGGSVAMVCNGGAGRARGCSGRGACAGPAGDAAAHPIEGPRAPAAGDGGGAGVACRGGGGVRRLRRSLAAAA
jgi:hypothetical protein